MRVLLTGATGYIGKLLMGKLLEQGHHVTCCVRRPNYFKIPKGRESQVDVVKVDFVNMDTELELNGDFEVAYYLIHSMSSSTRHFDEMEQTAAVNFRELIDGCNVKQVIYLSGISNEETLSKHLQSRFQVEEELQKGATPVTVLRAGIIVGAGSASFELLRDLVEKLPVMITPKWLHTRCQPIAIENVLSFLTKVANQPQYFNKIYDIGGPDILSYKQMLEIFAEVRGLKRYIGTVPIMSPRLSSYWLFFVTSISYPLAVNLVDSMKVEVICRPNNLAAELGIELLIYEKACMNALKMYVGDKVVSSWKDALSSSYSGEDIEQYNQVPEYGILSDLKVRPVPADEVEQVIENIWSIGGKRGWYYGTWLWKIRGFMDKMAGGIGLRRGRTHNTKLAAGDALDFWRVIDADRQEKRLLLLAEMKLPGEAWLEFDMKLEGDSYNLYQTATFRPKGLWGRIYWYLVSPLHYFVFNGMIREIVRFKPGTVSPTEVPELTK